MLDPCNPVGVSVLCQIQGSGPNLGYIMQAAMWLFIAGVLLVVISHTIHRIRRRFSSDPHRDRWSEINAMTSLANNTQLTDEERKIIRRAMAAKALKAQNAGEPEGSASAGSPRG